MLETRIRIALIIAVICYFTIILVYLKNKTLNLKYTLLWLLAGVGMGIMVIFPKVLYWLSAKVGIYAPANALFMLAIAFILMILMSITSIVSRQNRKIRTLVQENAILEKRVREIEKQLGEKQDENI